MTVKYNKWPNFIPNGGEINQNFLFPYLPKFTRILVFGLKKYPSGNPGRLQAPAEATEPMYVFLCRFFDRNLSSVFIFVCLILPVPGRMAKGADDKTIVYLSHG
jgi:hypothetical protein